MNRISLFYSDIAVGGTSDKEYHVQIEKHGKGFVVNFQYGRRGGTLQTGTKTITAVPEPEAQQIFQRLVAEKTKNGYQPVEPSDLRAPGFIARHDPDAMEAAIAAADNRTEFPIEEMEEVGPEEAESYIKSPNYVMQFKEDAEHRQVEKNAKGVRGYNKRGLAVILPVELADELRALDMRDFLLVGEIEGSKLVVWDMLRAHGVSIASQAYESRLMQLEALIPPTNKLITVSETFHTTAGKQSALAKAVARRLEGVCFKLRTAPYRAGTGSHKKFKFLKSASCKVVAVRVGGKSNAAVALRDGGGKWREVAHVSTIGKGTIEVGMIVKVLFLYATAGKRLFQPRIKEVRTDVTEFECSLKRQLPLTVFKAGIAA